ncbi:hypothetical protein M427DRAFT_45308 [Gonapodya prolifera JEL478]|uniref:Carboxylic ester hydrolase n=1 Tax=Gonapodya prolifera (strain JEL478) TaxID=1344416 RepID=A0A139ABH0_GONPJ|nr:hypothetical protein M427DRAFT_45308 [Gonapodya prolifera JEL478]|eukprot:KXS14019.1 hypothetical protein M427DRAFT_45308 [Gonapodya prolifera JEL478]
MRSKRRLYGKILGTGAYGTDFQSNSEVSEWEIIALLVIPGLLDQIAATQCVANNISNFGGDHDRITLYGESSGASHLMEQGNCQSLSDLRDIPKEELFRCADEYQKISIVSWRPVFDGDVPHVLVKYRSTAAAMNAGYAESFGAAKITNRLSNWDVFLEGLYFTHMFLSGLESLTAYRLEDFFPPHLSTSFKEVCGPCYASGTHQSVKAAANIFFSEFPFQTGSRLAVDALASKVKVYRSVMDGCQRTRCSFATRRSTDLLSFTFNNTSQCNDAERRLPYGCTRTYTGDRGNLMSIRPRFVKRRLATYGDAIFRGYDLEKNQNQRLRTRTFTVDDVEQQSTKDINEGRTIVPPPSPGSAAENEDHIGVVAEECSTSDEIAIESPGEEIQVPPTPVEPLAPAKKLMDAASEG